MNAQIEKVKAVLYIVNKLNLFFLNRVCINYQKEFASQFIWTKCDNSVFDRSIRPVQNLRKREWTTAAIDFKLYCGEENKNALLTSMGMVGQVIGSIGGGVYSDKFGRKNAIIVWERL